MQATYGQQTRSRPTSCTCVYVYHHHRAGNMQHLVFPDWKIIYLIMDEQHRLHFPSTQNSSLFQIPPVRQHHPSHRHWGGHIRERSLVCEYSQAISKLSHRSFAMLASDDSPGFDSDLSISAEIHHVCQPVAIGAGWWNSPHSLIRTVCAGLSVSVHSNANEWQNRLR